MEINTFCANNFNLWLITSKKIKDKIFIYYGLKNSILVYILDQVEETMYYNHTK